MTTLDSLVVPGDGALATGPELEVLAGAAAEGWSYSLEELRVNRRRALAGLEALEGSRQERAGARPAPPASSGSADPSRTRQSTAWGFTDLEGGSAAVSVVLDGTGGDRL